VTYCRPIALKVLLAYAVKPKHQLNRFKNVVLQKVHCTRSVCASQMTRENITVRTHNILSSVPARLHNYRKCHYSHLYNVNRPCDLLKLLLSNLVA